MYSTNSIEDILKHTEKLSISETIDWLTKSYVNKVLFSTSFGKEDQALTHLIFENNLPVRVFTLDTGRLFQETYDTFESTRKKYKQNIEVFYPQHDQIEHLLKTKGPNSFYESVENRKECCAIRKVEPLKRALSDGKIWITGLMADQTDFRKDLPIFEYDSYFNIIKYNPLLRWTRSELEIYIEQNEIPVNALHSKGFPSIGCAPCTRAITADEDYRAGRWWWENSHKECGIHLTQKH